MSLFTELCFSLKNLEVVAKVQIYPTIMNENTEKDLQIYATCFFKENMLFQFMSHQELC